ncbi:MAG: DUF6717 family protein [Flavobacteriales bacterium]
MTTKMKLGFVWSALEKWLTPRPSNAILTLNPYMHRGQWVFDDDRVGLEKEPFVAGADDFIDYVFKLRKQRAEAKKGFKLVFSKHPFPGHHFTLSKLRRAYGGTFYKVDDSNFENHEGVNEMWLCPALNLYYRSSPGKLYVSLQVEI